MLVVAFVQMQAWIELSEKSELIIKDPGVLFKHLVCVDFLLLTL